MRSFNESEFKTSLLAASRGRGLSTDRRRASCMKGCAPRQARAHQRYIEGLAAANLAANGFDIDGFQKAREEDQKYLRSCVEEQKTNAIKYSAAAQHSLRHGVDSRIKNVHLVPAPRALELLEKPFLIWWTQGIDFPEIHYDALNSRAKFRIRSESGITEDEMGFYYLWSNPTEAHQVINIDGFLIADGFCLAQSDGGFWAGFRFGLVEIVARLRIFESLSPPPVEPLFQPSQEQTVVRVATGTGGFMDSDAVDFEHVFKGCILQHQQLIVPPGDSVVFEVAFSMVYGSDEGATEIDFASGDFQVVSPAVIVAVVS
jgi:hypothetical protein